MVLLDDAVDDAEAGAAGIAQRHAVAVPSVLCYAMRMVQPRIPIPQEQLAVFCRRHHIRKLALFGSVLRDDFRPDSDVDVLVEFEPGQRVGFLRLVGMELELSDLIGRKADVRTPNELSRYFRDDVVASAEVQYP